MAAPKTRANGEGTVFYIPDRGVWRAQKTLSTFKTATGRWQAVKVSGEAATKHEALRRCDKNYRRRLVAMGQLPATAMDSSPTELRLSTEAYLLQWLAERDDIAPGTAYGYERKIRNHVCGRSGIGKIPLRLVTPADIKTLIHGTLPGKTNADGSAELNSNSIRAPDSCHRGTSF